LQHLEPNDGSRNAGILPGGCLTKIPEVAELLPNFDSCTNATPGAIRLNCKSGHASAAVTASEARSKAKPREGWQAGFARR
jgi:hypothetical protein